MQKLKFHIERSRSRENYVAYSIFKLQDTSYTCKPNFIRRKKTYFGSFIVEPLFRLPRRKEAGGKRHLKITRL